MNGVSNMIHAFEEPKSFSWRGCCSAKERKGLLHFITELLAIKPQQHLASILKNFHATVSHTQLVCRSGPCVQDFHNLLHDNFLSSLPINDFAFGCTTFYCIFNTSIKDWIVNQFLRLYLYPVEKSFIQSVTIDDELMICERPNHRSRKWSEKRPLESNRGRSANLATSMFRLLIKLWNRRGKSFLRRHHHHRSREDTSW